MANYNIDAIYNGSTSLPGTERVRIDGAGNIGIGASTPLTRLFVSGSSSVNENLPTTYIRNSFPGTHGYGLSVSRNGSDTSALCFGSDSSLNSIIASNNTDLRIGKGQSNTFTEYIRVNTNGNVGIGTSSPNTLLNVHGANPFVRINDTSATGHGIKISYNNSDTHGLHLTYNGNGAQSYIDNTYGVTSGQVYGDIYFRQNVSGVMTTRMTIKADGGSIGIGTTSPATKLDVVGNVKATSFTGSFSGSIVKSLGYLYAGRSTSQTIPAGGSTWANVNITMSKVYASGSIGYNSTNGVVSLKARAVYRITAALSINNSSNNIGLNWSLFKHSNNAQIAQSIATDFPTYAFYTANMPMLDMIYAPTSSVDVKLRCTAANTQTNVLQIYSENTYLIVQQLA